LPRNGRVAIVLRGHAFRNAKIGCNPEQRDYQLAVTGLFVSNVVEPLEKLGNKVDIIAGIDKHCKMMSEIVELLGHGRILATPDVKALDQSRAMRLALDGFKSAIQGVEVADQYDLIFIVRHDIIWKQPITVFNTDFSNLNFADWCKYFDKCLNDIVQVMPGRIFTVFDSMVNQPGCFDFTARDHCHYAFAQLSQKLFELKETAVVSVLVDFRLKEDVREVNPYMELMSLLA